MSTDILATLNGWLGNGSTPPVETAETSVSKCEVSSLVSTGSVVAKSEVATQVATESLVAKHEVAKEVATGSVVTKGEVTRAVTTDSAVTKQAPTARTPPVPDSWTNDEVAQYEARARTFKAKGVPPEQSEILASRLVRRDQELDDRRSCGECASFYGGRCLQGRYPIGEATIYTLHRCKGFKLSEVPNE